MKHENFFMLLNLPCFFFALENFPINIKSIRTKLWILTEVLDEN